MRDCERDVVIGNFFKMCRLVISFIPLAFSFQVGFICLVVVRVFCCLFFIVVVVFSFLHVNP